METKSFVQMSSRFPPFDDANKWREEGLVIEVCLCFEELIFKWIELSELFPASFLIEFPKMFLNLRCNENGKISHRRERERETIRRI